MTEATPMSDELTAIVEMIRVSGLTDASLTLAERSALLDLDSPVPEGTTVEVLDAGAVGFRGEWIAAPDSTSDRAVVHLHGGAYTAGGPGSHRPFAAELSAGAGCPVLLLDYRLAPADPFPAAFNDALAAYRWLCGSNGKGLDPASIVISGDSAGGGLAAAVLVALRDEGTDLPAGAVLLSPWTDLALSGGSHATQDGLDPICSTATLTQSVQAYVPKGVDVRDPRVSPLYSDLNDLPPLLIHVGEVEVLRDDAVSFAERATAAGTEVELLVAPGLVHVWHLFSGIAPESTRDLAVVTEWIRARTS
ncbi:MAG: alpha/beta hydrolase [Microthrixaceae bacterium]